tara:strand:+ start:108 stop:251 length:144 start_codon:yes stop_codon:yes gene_type:complete
MQIADSDYFGRANRNKPARKAERERKKRIYLKIELGSAWNHFPLLII